MDWQMLKSRVLRMAPEFNSGSCSFLFSLNDRNVGWGEDSGPSSAIAWSGGGWFFPENIGPMVPGASQEKWLSHNHGASVHTLITELNILTKFSEIFSLWPQTYSFLNNTSCCF